MDLSVEIPKKAVRFTGTVTLQDCLDKFVEPEKMIDCGFKCEACLKKVSVEKDLTLFRLPRVLVVHLKRFYHSAMRKDKLNTTVNFPESLDMRRYMPHSSKLSLNCRPFFETKFSVLFVWHFSSQRQSVRWPLHRRSQGRWPLVQLQRLNCFKNS